jgi:hypothetical protein
MASPRIFVSSTCYDLKYIRENLKYFIRNLGCEPVLSEDGAVFYDPTTHTHDSCLIEVPNCQLFVLIIGGRFGGEYKGDDISITNKEYREAVKRKIPVFTLIEQAVYSDHHVYTKNRDNDKIDNSKILYPSIDKKPEKIFKFIDEIRSQNTNNAIAPFGDFADIENYLRQQWAGMMFSFLLRDNENKRNEDIMVRLVAINENIAFLSKQLLKDLGSNESKVLLKLYELMNGRNITKVLKIRGIEPNPISILEFETFSEYDNQLENPLNIIAGNLSITSIGSETITYTSDTLNKDYQELRNEMVKTVKNEGLTVKELIESQSSKKPTTS